MRLTLEHKKILIYGATGGIGKAICIEALQQNADLFLLGRSKNRLKKLSEELGIPSNQFYQIDNINSDESLNKLQQWLEPIKGEGFFAGIHCVGAGIIKRTKDITLQEWNATVALNLSSAFCFYKLLWSIRNPQQTELVFLGSASTDQVWPKNALYGASKAGLEYFAKSLQKEIKNEKGRVWLYRPGAVDTEFFDQIKNHLPREKMITPRELAKMILFNFTLENKIYFPEIELLSD